MIAPTDDELGRLIRSLDPARTPRDAELTTAQLALRDRITTSPTRFSRGRSDARRRWALVVTPLAAVAAIALFVVWSVASPVVPVPPVTALTPPILTFVDSGQTTANVVADAQVVLASGEGDVGAHRGAVTTGWYFHVDDVGSSHESAVISPEVSVLEWAADQSGSMTVYAGVPYWADLSSAPLPDSVPAAGTMLWTMEYAPGEAQQPDVDLPVDTAASVLALMRAHGLSDSADGYDVLHTIDLVQQSWTLTNAQHAFLLELVGEARGVSVLGDGNDRAGRAITALSVDMPGDKSELHMFVSRDTGRIIGVEVFMTVATDQFPADAIVSYSMWDLPQ